MRKHATNRIALAVTATYMAVRLVALGAEVPADPTRVRLPIEEIDTIVGIEGVRETPGIRDLLKTNGFAVSRCYCHQIFTPYTRTSLPPFITCDSLHRTFHVIFEEQLKLMETALSGEVSGITAAMLHEFHRQATAGEPDDSILLAEGYFAVAARLLDPAADVAPALAGKVTEELRLIEAAGGVAPSPLFGYDVDYSQFKPRGFYVETVVLQRFFRAMSWYGNIAFRLISDRETRAALQIARAYSRAGETKASWEKIDRTYSRLIAPTDDLTPQEYADVAETCKDADPAEWLRRHSAQLRDPKINSMVIYPMDIPRWKELTKGMRFFGKRCLPDSEVFMNVTDPKVAHRGFPTGLDMMAVNGSERAEELVRAQKEFGLPGYDEGLARSRRMVDALKAAPERSHYMNFLRLIETLEQPGNPVPSFMETAAWRDKTLMSSLGAWASMRHTWQLQAKQSVTYLCGMYSEEPPKGYVEPNLAFLQRLDALTADTLDILKGLQRIDIQRLGDFRNLLGQVTAIARKQLASQPLTFAEGEFLEGYGPRIANLCYFSSNSWVADEHLPWMGLVADVHTEHESGQALEVATGGALPIYVVVPHKGRLFLMVGGIYAYHEFHQPIGERMTDADWHRVLDRGLAPPLPDWTASFVAPPDVDGALAEIRPGRIVKKLEQINDPRVAAALWKQLQPGGAYGPVGNYWDSDSEERFARMLGLELNSKVMSFLDRAWEKSWRARHWAIRLYALKAGKEAMPFLLQTLGTSHGRAAARGIAAVARAEDIAILKQIALRAKSQEARENAVLAIGLMNLPEVQDTLIEMLHQSRDRRLTAIVIGWLGSRSKDVTPELLRLLPEADGETHGNIIQSLGELWGEPFADDGMDDRFPSRLAPEQERELRLQVQAVLSKELDSPDADPSIFMVVPGLWQEEGIQKLESVGINNAKRRVDVIRTLCQMAETTAMAEGRATRMSTGRDTVQTPAGDPFLAAARRLLERSIKEKDDHVAEAVACLREVGDMAILPLLHRLLETDVDQVLDEVLEALADMEPDGPGYDDDLKEQFRQAWLAYRKMQEKGGPGNAGPQLVENYVRRLVELLDARGGLDHRESMDFHNARAALAALPYIAAQDSEDLFQKLHRHAIDIMRMEMKTIIEGLMWGKKKEGAYPSEATDEWVQTLQAYSRLNMSRLQVEGAVLDVWGSPCRYLNPSRHGKQPVEVYSFGPNRKDEDGEGDDITSWEAGDDTN